MQELQSIHHTASFRLFQSSYEPKLTISVNFYKIMQSFSDFIYIYIYIYISELIYIVAVKYQKNFKKLI